jgi:endonuclease/exonuclease/phosphatase family metal-dependent hydrolase
MRASTLASPLDRVRAWPVAIALAIAGFAVHPFHAADPANPVAHWTLDDSASADDSTGNGHTGVVSGATETGGKFGGALFFTGDDAIAVANTAGLTPASGYAISAWVKFTQTGPSGGEVASMGDSYALRVQPTGEVKSFFYNGTSYENVALSTLKANDDRWHHIVGQYTGSAVEVYIDGTLAGSRALTGSGVISYTKGNTFTLGRHGNGGANHFFKGAIDQVRVYDHHLSAAQIGDLWAEAPAAHWTLDNGAAVDSSGNGNTGVVSGGTATPGRFAGALSFSGNGGVTVAAPVGLKPPAGYAISAWVNFTQTGPSGGEVASMGDSYALRVQPTGEVKSFFYNGTYENIALSTVRANNGAWRHLVGQYTGSAVEVYIDGTLAGSRALTGSGTIQYSLGTGFTLGRHGNGGSNHFFKGALDQVRVYGRSLSAAEIQSLTAEPPPTPQTETTFTVLTWNLAKGRGTDNVPDIDRTARWIRDHAAADVLLLSAVENFGEADRIRQILGWPVDNVHFRAVTGEGQAILSHFDMPTSSPLCPPQGCRTDSPVTCANQTESQTIVHATVIIAGTPVNFFAIDQQHDPSQQDKSAVRLCQAQAGTLYASNFPDPRIVAGDFNEKVGTLGMNEWLASYYGAWDESTAKQGYPGNDSGVDFGRTRKSRIDHILFARSAANVEVGEARVFDARDFTTTCSQVQITFCSNCTACTSSWVDDRNVRPSDHIPFRAVFTIR